MAAPRFGTFSIVACDRDTGTWGVAVQSKFIAVGAVVPFAEAGVGAIATQAAANVAYGPEGLALLRAGKRASDVVEALTRADAGRDERQLGVVDREGRAASFTGSHCLDWAGHVVGDGFACQGNILFGPGVVKGMARTFEATPGDLVDRLLGALAAGQREGGDRRGMQSAALLVVRARGGYGQGNDRWIDVRVDDHPTPIEELRRVFRLYDLTMLTREDPATLVPLAGEVAAGVQHDLNVLGFYPGRSTGRWDPASRAAFTKFLNEHNFENKARDDDRTWPSILGYLRERASAETARRTTTAPIVPGALDRGPGAQGPSGGAPSPPGAASKEKGKHAPK
ncbi:MAG TPA: DUF1028 domain-containing protein [Thermoplasmata archaeon]|nr:DUF1028 domain-containing protein [Thermoplasmata archaeon]